MQKQSISSKHKSVKDVRETTIKGSLKHDVAIDDPITIDESVYKEKIRAEIALNSISDAVICTDINCNIDYLNIAAEKLTGWTREEANDLPVYQVFNRDCSLGFYLEI